MSREFSVVKSSVPEWPSDPSPDVSPDEIAGGRLVVAAGTDRTTESLRVDTTDERRAVSEISLRRRMLGTVSYQRTIVVVRERLSKIIG